MRTNVVDGMIETGMDNDPHFGVIVRVEFLARFYVCQPLRAQSASAKPPGTANT